MLRLTRYAYGLHSVAAGDKLETDIADASLVDLLTLQLCAEVRALAAGGLHRRYVTKRATLNSPRGRIDFTSLARYGASPSLGIPCVLKPRLEDIRLNRILFSGIRFAARASSAPSVRAAAQRTTAMYGEGIEDVALTARELEGGLRSLDRLTETYRAALTLIDAIFTGSGVSFETAASRVALPGFLFDMNRFFQHLVSRFLHDFLDGFSVRDEHVLKGMLTYDTDENPRRRRAPSPRPDFAIQRGRRTVALLDAKYRDLWNTKLPREMLYQLSIYALSQSGPFEAAILYPTTEDAATLQKIEIKDPSTGGLSASVALRPVNLRRLEELVSGPVTSNTRKLARLFASELALGKKDSD